MIRSTAKFQTQRAGMTVMACTLAIMLAPSVTAAFPNRLVQDRTWAQSAQWLPLRVNRGPGFQTLTIDLNPTLMSCDDPLQRPALGPHPICGSFDSTFVDVWIHVFSATTGLEVMAPIHRTPPAPLPPGPGIRHFATAQLALPRGDFALMVHGGVDARGIISVSMAVRPGAAQAGLPLGDWNDVRFSDNLMFDVANRPEPFVVESVLVPDGPAAIDQDTGVVLPNSRGNDPNDWMGVDGTEVWLMEPVNGIFVRADLQMAGVGPSGRLSVSENSGYVLVRPFVRPPFRLARFPLNDSENGLPHRPGRLRAVLNTETDSDHDRLGDRVEREIHTCDGVHLSTTTFNFNGIACATEAQLEANGGTIGSMAFMDPRDTDGDGISDGAEFLGADTTFGRQPNPMGGTQSAGPPSQIMNASQTFPAWGFSPLHKDVLFEIDRTGSMSTTPCAAGVGGAFDRQHGCTRSRSVFPLTNADGAHLPVGAPLEDLSQSFRHLWIWRRSYNELPADRVANPDGVAGIETHFDMRVVPNEGTEDPVYSLRGPIGGLPDERFGTAGILTRSFNGGLTLGGECGCNANTVAVDPRHGGFARWGRGYLESGGQNACGGVISASMFALSGTMMHETGHTFGLHHGGPTLGSTCNSNPFSVPESSTDGELEDKVIFPSTMSYAYGYYHQSNRSFPAYSLGTFAPTPLPRLATDTTLNAMVLGWPEQDPFGPGINAEPFADFYRPNGTHPYPFVRNGMNQGMDFNQNTVLDLGRVVRGPVEAAQAYDAGAGNFPIVIRDLWCDGEQIAVRSGGCCPPGTTRTLAGICVDDNDRPTSSLVSPEPRSMFGAGSFAAVLANQRLYGLYMDDMVSELDAVRAGRPLPRRCGRADVDAGRCDAWVERGKIRWVAMDTVGTPTASEVPADPRYATAAGLNARIPCEGAGHLCGHVTPGQATEGDVRAAGAPITSNGITNLSATTFTEGGVERIAVAVTAQTGVTCNEVVTVDIRGNRNTRYQNCPWGLPRLFVGSSANFEQGQLQQLPLPDLAEPVSSMAIAGFDPENNGQPSAFIVVAAKATNNSQSLHWARCTTAACSVFQPLFDPRAAPGTPLTSVSRIALAVQRARGAAPARLAMVVGASVGLALFPVFVGFELVNSGLTVPAVQNMRAVNLTQNLGMATQAAMSAAFDNDDKLVVSFENRDVRTAVSTTLLPPFSVPAADPIPMTQPANRNHAYSRNGWKVPYRVQVTILGSTTTVSSSGSAPDFGRSTALVFDSRPRAVAVRPDSRPDPRFTTFLNREFSNVVRGFGFEPAPDGLSLRFFPRMSADPIGPRFDYDESATIAFNLCQQVAVTSGGYRGGDLSLPRAGLNGTDRIRCPGVSRWAENVVLINRVQLTMQIMREGEAVSIPDTVADLVTSPSWYGAAPADPPVAPPQFVPITRTCASGAGVGAYWEEQILATQNPGTTP